MLPTYTIITGSVQHSDQADRVGVHHQYFLGLLRGTMYAEDSKPGVASTEYIKRAKYEPMPRILSFQVPQARERGNLGQKILSESCGLRVWSVYSVFCETALKVSDRYSGVLDLGSMPQLDRRSNAQQR